jgi:hypothetical protein
MYRSMEVWKDTKVGTNTTKPLNRSNKETNSTRQSYKSNNLTTVVAGLGNNILWLKGLKANVTNVTCKVYCQFTLKNSRSKWPIDLYMTYRAHDLLM